MQIFKIPQTGKIISLIFLLSTFFYPSAHGQSLSLTTDSINKLDLSDSRDVIKDINGEICSIVILETDIDSVKFFSNRGVEKIHKTHTGYKLWIPREATVLKMVIPGFALYEYDLPASDYEYSVYIFILNTIKPNNVQVIDTLKPVLSFDSEPDKAKVFLNEKYIGKTPLNIEDPKKGKFSYRILKKTYKTVSSVDSIYNQSNNIMAELEDMSSGKRVFFLPLFTTPELLLLPDNGFSRAGADNLPLGIMLGKIGGTGWYAESIFVNREWEDDFDHNKMNKILINGGVTRQISRNIFLNAGGGFIRREYEDFNDERPEYNFLEKGINLETGLTFRIPWLFLFNTNVRFVFIFDEGKLKPAYYSIGIGFGMNFDAEKFADAFR